MTSGARLNLNNSATCGQIKMLSTGWGHGNHPQISIWNKMDEVHNLFFYKKDFGFETRNILPGILLTCGRNAIYHPNSSCIRVTSSAVLPHMILHAAVWNFGTPTPIPECKYNDPCMNTWHTEKQRHTIWTQNFRIIDSILLS